MEKEQQLQDLVLNDGLGKEKPDVVALYLIYNIYADKNGKCFLKIPQLCELLKISVYRVRKARRKLIDLGYIIPESAINKKTETLQHFVTIKN